MRPRVGIDVSGGGQPMKVLVAGASGVIGRVLVPQLVAAGHDVVGTTRKQEAARGIEAQGASALICDFFDPPGVSRAFGAAQPEVAVHQLTAIPEDLDPRKMEQAFETTNRLRSEGTRNLLAAARDAGCRRVVAQSIAFAYAPKQTAMHVEEDPLWTEATPIFAAAQDLEGQVLAAEGIEGLVLRYGFFYGPGTAYASDGGSATAVRKRRFPIVGAGRGEWSFIHVDDAAAATVAAVERGAPGVYNVVDDEPAPMREWLPEYAEALGAKRPLRVPVFMARLAAGRLVTHYGTRMRGASNDKAKRELGWEPRYSSWREGFRKALG